MVIDKSAYAGLAARDAANLLNHPDAQVDPDDRSDPDGARFYDVDQLSLHHAPDPPAFRFALRLLDGPHAGFLDVYPFDDPDHLGSWHHLLPVRLVAFEGSGAPSFDPVRHLLRVPLEVAQVVVEPA